MYWCCDHKTRAYVFLPRANKPHKFSCECQARSFAEHELLLGGRVKIQIGG